VVYYAGKTSCWEPRDKAEPSHRRVRYNAATGYHEAIGGGGPPAAYPSRDSALQDVQAAQDHAFA
jgi:hypothetical protein